MKKLLPFLGLAAVALSMLSPSSAHAGLLDILPGGDGGGGGAPEIDASVLGSAMALVMGGAAVLRDRFRR